MKKKSDKPKFRDILQISDQYSQNCPVYQKVWEMVTDQRKLSQPDNYMQGDGLGKILEQKKDFR